jgi:hypothetical protein
MTSKKKSRSYGIPAPITKLTTEQDLRLRLIQDALEKDETRKEDIITVFLALQKQNFVLANSLTNLVEKWPPTPTQADLDTISEVLPMFGILLENKD